MQTQLRMHALAFHKRDDYTEFMKFQTIANSDSSLTKQMK